LLILGCFVEGTTLLILAAPILAPLANAVGIDPIHFGIIIVVNVQVGTITPPFGQIVFFISSVGRIPAEAIFNELGLFVPALLASLVFVTYMPDAYLWVANLLVP
jgi:TRAP-type C4-dicarboxylate transport system permease large subunit